MAQNKKIKKMEDILKSEDLKVREIVDGKVTHIITQKRFVSPIEFLLYKVESNDEYSFIASANNPNKLEEKYVFSKKKKGIEEE